MISVLRQADSYYPIWVDVENPTQEELQQVADQYGLNSEAVIDCLEPSHLPKYEEIGDLTFIISRLFDINAPKEANSILKLTHKLAIFCGKNFIVTIHRSPVPFLYDICSKLLLKEGKKGKNIYYVIALILNSVLLSYNCLIDQIDEDLANYEENIFLKDLQTDMTKQFYLIKRKASLSLKVIYLNKEIINRLEFYFKGPIVQDLKDTYTATFTSLESIIENAGYLISTYLSMMSQHTNDIMRTLTILSVFFMPLTFIVGLYGMNFELIPEIHWEYGYLFVWTIMIIITIIIYLYFKIKKWM